MITPARSENVTLHHDWAPALAGDIASAERSIYITSLSMQLPRRAGATPHHLILDALTKAPARGVRVDVVLPPPSKAHPACAFNRQVAGVLHAFGARVWFAPVSNLLHAKTATIDEQIVWVGSGNWTAAAANHNREAYLRVASATLAQQQLRHWRECGLQPQPERG